jgi:hypothetical protein
LQYSDDPNSGDLSTSQLREALQTTFQTPVPWTKDLIGNMFQRNKVDEQIPNALPLPKLVTMSFSQPTSPRTPASFRSSVLHRLATPAIFPLKKW